ncbi:MAG: NnrS family protein [Gammaproteobacteria bacterium]|nr:NnrS family protein [Gammaproteobacteria bacterium]
MLFRHPLFAYGFRPFFFFCGLYALLVMPAWLLIRTADVAPFSGLPAQLWHAHEMLFGFSIAAISGFLLSGVPSWTRNRGFGGLPVFSLTLAWLAGRAAFALAPFCSLPVLAAVELAFLPLLVALIAPPIIRERNRNIAMLAVLAALWIADAAFLLGVARSDAVLASRALLTAMNIILLLLTIVGGRILPAFTSNALRRTGTSFSLHRYAWLETILPIAMIAVIALDMVQPGRLPQGWLAIVVAVLHAVRLSGWRSLRTRGDPMLWVLHLAYAWLPLGFALKGIALLGNVDWAQYWQHGFGIGAIATMILAVATRTALGHTGRPLVVGRPIVVAYLLVGLAALLRVAGPVLWPGAYPAVLLAAGLCWMLAFLIFIVVYAPILGRPRADGRPG